MLRQLGAGGAGVVYEAYDREHGARVALKVLQNLQPNAILRFKEEFRALQDLQHPNLVTLGELFEEGGRWFFTMEYIDGIELLDYVGCFPRPAAAEASEERTVCDAPGAAPAASAPPPLVRSMSARRVLRAPFDERKLRSALTQIVRGVRALHAAGKVHRDVKASNILVTHDGRAVLLDFGLIMDTRRAREESETRAIVGTAKYMAPEQAAAGVVGPQADCYSLGVVFYRALTGHFPFGEATGGALAELQRQRPIPPARFFDGVPSDLNDLCLELLRVDAERRPTCDEVLERLAASPQAHAAAPPALPARQEGRGPFVGREAELAALRGAFDCVARGKASALAVLGESGVGKSTLARHFAELIAAETGAVVLSARCYERESVPFKAVDGIIDALSRFLARLPSLELAGDMRRKAALLAQAFPVLRRVRAFSDAVQASPPSEVDPKERRVQLFAAVRALFGALAERVPVVLVIDDLQWSDADSLALLRELLRPPQAPPVLLLATARAAGDAAPEDILRPIGEVGTLHLEPLGQDDAHLLAVRLLVRAPWAHAEVAARIAREASGHPLFIDELVRHALQGGEEEARTARLEDALLARVERLEPVERQVMAAVSVAGGPLRLDVLAHATSTDAAVLARAVSRLRIAHLVRATGIRRFDRLDTYHDRIRGAVLARTRDDVRRTWHRRIATAIEAHAPAEVDALVTHWARAGANDATKASRYALIAAANAERALAFERAAHMYSLALTLNEDHGGRDQAADARAIRVSLGAALVNAGRGAQAAEAFLAAAEGARADVAVDLQRRAAEQLLFSGRLDEGLSVLQRVLAAIGMEVPQSSSGAVASLLVRRGQLRWRGMNFDECAADDCEEGDLRRIDMLAAISGALGMVDAVRGADFQTRHLLHALRTGEPHRVVRALSLEAVYSATSGSRGAARTAQIATRARELSERLGSEPVSEAWALTASGAAAFLEGRWEDAHEILCSATWILRERCAGQAFALDTATFYQLAALFHLGEMKELGRRIPALVEEATQRGDLYALTQLRSGVLAVAWLARGDAAGARREADDAIARWPRRGIHLPHFLDLLAQAQIDLYEGDARGAYERVAERWKPFSRAHLFRVQFIRIKMLELRGRAALAIAFAEPTEAEPYVAEAERCARRIAAEETRWGTPFAHLLHAGVSLARGRSGDASALLRTATDGFAAAHMGLHVAVCRMRLADLGGSARAPLLAAASRSWMQDQGIGDPERLAQTIAPSRSAAARDRASLSGARRIKGVERPPSSGDRRRAPRPLRPAPARKVS